MKKLNKYGLISDFRSRSKLLKHFRKKSIPNYMKYLEGVRLMVNSIFSHGYIVAKIFFLNPVKCTCIAQLMQGNEGNEEIKKENGRVEETKKELSILSIDKTVHS